MRKHHQKQILEIIHTLNDAHAEIRRLLFKTEPEALIELLENCQHAAVTIGTFIENLEGEGTNTVSYLEEYCGILHEISESIGNSNANNPLTKKLKKQLVKIENGVKDELKPNRIEIAFFPYKASMFDCFESIWRAAKNDPQCDAYVVPIPYFDRLPGGEFGEMHYEGEQYPDYVEITDWQTYNLEERRPDVIFTHNPYDENNYVTSVHPDYYSRRLKTYTDMLCYIPYFVVTDGVPEHFCVCSGSFYSDKVFVQSEKVREMYIRAFKKFEAKNNCAGKFGNAKTKFVASGSPKFDKVIESKPGDYTVPDEWRKLIERPDGTRKKIVLYNTSVGAILQNDEQYIEKLKHVLDSFADRDDVVLWWRPHPLNGATYESMRPRLLEDYEHIVEEYRNGGTGIYDDTSDLHRAIALTDAYYGDESSLVAMYGLTGKPIMIQNAHLREPEESYFGLPFDSVYDDGSCYWFSALNHNALYRMDKSTWKSEFIGIFPGEEETGWYLYRSIAECNGKLYFAPGAAKEIAEYDIEKKIFRKIPFKQMDNHPKLVNHGNKFITAISYKSCVFFGGGSYPAFIRYDTRNGQLDYYSDWVKPLCDMIVTKENVFLVRAVLVDERNFAVASAGASAVVFFNMDECISRVYKVGKGSYGYQSVTGDGSDFWLTPRRDGPIVRWNRETGTYKEYDYRPEGFVWEATPFSGAVLGNGYLWMFPLFESTNMALKLRVSDGTTEIAEEFQDVCSQKMSAAEFFGQNYFLPLLPSTGDNLVLAHTGKGNRLIIFDSCTGEKQEGIVAPTSETIEILRKTRMRYFQRKPGDISTVPECSVYEGPFAFLSDLIDYIVNVDASGDNRLFRQRQIELFSELNAKSDTTAGESIWLLCKSDVMR